MAQIKELQVEGILRMFEERDRQRQQAELQAEAERAAQEYVEYVDRKRKARVKEVVVCMLGVVISIIACVAIISMTPNKQDYYWAYDEASGSVYHTSWEGGEQ